MAIQTPTENWFKFPNHIADNLHTYEANDLKVLVLILRRTIGMLGLTSNPDQRFSISFIAKKCKMSENTARTVKERLLKRGDIKQDGTASDGSPLYSIVWNTPKNEGDSKFEGAPQQNLRREGVQNLNPDKDIILKKGEEKTLDASASSAAPEKERFEIIHLPPDVKIETKVQVTGSKEGKKKLQAAVEDQKIPYKEIQKLFLDKHKEFRKIKDEKFMPKWNVKEQQAIKRLYNGLKNQNETGSRYIELNDNNILVLFGNMIKAFTEYLKNGGSNTYTETTPILPSQLTDKVLNRLIPYLQKEASRPKLEIKKYEQTGIHIGPMPEGW